MALTSNPNVGDRVRYTYTMHANVSKGDEGTVTEIVRNGPRVRWDNGYHSRYNHALYCLELIEEPVIEEDWS